MADNVDKLQQPARETGPSKISTFEPLISLTALFVFFEFHLQKGLNLRRTSLSTQTTCFFSFRGCCALASSIHVATAESLVKARCQEQREAAPREPRCVICGRYGEYICDETEDDVCSLECKEAVLRKLRSEAATCAPSSSISAVKIPAIDECVYVRDGQPCLPIWEAEDSIKSLNRQQIEALRRQIQVDVKGEDVLPPILDFSNCNFTPKLKENLQAAGYEIPTPVQMQAIPAALKGRDLLVSATTGLGKTACFFIPIITRCAMIRTQKLSERVRPLAIVLTPTRELCAQVEEQAKAIAVGLPFKTALVVGGDPMPRQVYRINQGIELIVATPGRLVDLLSRNDFELEDVCMLVLDEVDCMLQRGFSDQVMQVVQELSNPQIMMFSATIPDYTEKLASKILKNYILVSVGEPSVPNGAVKQTVIWVESKKKKQKLFDILNSAQHFKPPAVVFVNSTIGADLLSDAIRWKTGLKVASIHGDKPMSERRQVLKSFLMSELSAAVATGVLGRGLDLLKVSQVIVFDMPNSLQEYTHQFGRASRLGMPGSAIIFVNNEDKALFKAFVPLLKAAGAPIPRELAYSPDTQTSYNKYNSQKKRKHHARQMSFLFCGRCLKRIRVYRSELPHFTSGKADFQRAYCSSFLKKNYKRGKQIILSTNFRNGFKDTLTQARN